MRAGAIAMRIFGEQPDHPGAAHYILHAFDDPDHAILALPAARAYASIAPAAPHALHMPSHIFLQLGMWPEAAASNEASWRASREWVERRALPASELDFHSLHWLLYVYLQQGRYAQAEALLRDMRDRLAAFPAGDARARVYATFTAASMAAAYIVETRQRHRAEELLGPPDRSAKQVPEALRAYVAVAQIPAIFARGLAAATLGSPQAGDSVAALRAIGKAKPRKPVPFVSELLAATEIQALEIQAASRAAAGDLEEALRIAERASALADRTPPPPGPPMVIKPAHELYGELLLAARRDGEAASHFDTAARRHPGRALSILGFARAAERSGDGQAAASAYAQLLQQWQHADATLPASQEARDYLARTRLSSGPRE
jgi:tetratricopeptide (TPR) repeat protein